MLQKREYNYLVGAQQFSYLTPFDPAMKNFLWCTWIICLDVHTLGSSSISRIDRSAVLDASWWWHSFSLGGRWLWCHHHAVHDLNCHLGENERGRKSGSGAELEKGAARKMPTLRHSTTPTHIPLHLNFPGGLYLNETSQSKSVKPNSRRTEEYLNRDAKHRIAFRCDTLPLRWYYFSVSVRLMCLHMLIRFMKAK